MLQVDQPTAAFRVFWRFENQPAREFVIPAHAKENNVNVLELDKVIAPTELAAGVQHVWVAGEAIVADGRVTGQRPGRMLGN